MKGHFEVSFLINNVAKLLTTLTDTKRKKMRFPFLENQKNKWDKNNYKKYSINLSQYILKYRLRIFIEKLLIITKID